VFFALRFAVPLLAGPVRRWLQKYVLDELRAGFGQTVPSVVGGLGVLAFAAGFIFVQIAGAAEGGRYPAGIFSAYASGVGILFAQAVLTRWLEREPAVRQVIER
jgi:amino acid transporter